MGETRDDAASLDGRIDTDAFVVAGVASLGDVDNGIVHVPPTVNAVLMTPRAWARVAGAPVVAETMPGLVEPLTPREREVLALAADGLSNREIASALDISEHTVKFHLASVFGKLGASSRTEAVRRGLQLGLVEI